MTIFHMGRQMMDEKIDAKVKEKLQQLLANQGNVWSSAILVGIVEVAHLQQL
jgi:hypothetical protein